MRKLLSFPNPVNEYAARTVAAGVIVLCLITLATGWLWLTAVLALGFVARVLTGPKLSPLGLLASRVIGPRIGDKPVPGPPKRFAQGMGAAMALTAAVLHFAWGFDTASAVFVGLITAAATLESVFGFCIGCKIFGLLMRAGVIPEETCEACSDIWSRRPAPASAP